MFMFRKKNVGQSRNKSIVNKSYENVAEFTYLGKTLTTKDFILEGVKIRECTLRVSAESFILPLAV